MFLKKKKVVAAIAVDSFAAGLYRRIAFCFGVYGSVFRYCGLGLGKGGS